ncbi:hypothetical protein ULMS_19310 [Patiriisocius marinistellae]|uniref:PIN domain-containing protein n=1 Tax=Patiriisocius marinistellae TaxID=2494560 RepID=A0A5J4FWN5_9FLAO|nr:PIN domain-containing protein [Patiriisocius marinistellae]GEQ86423.1 hypothetical protein ULMS_19310 [Patiriisocius marinistellae]
MNTKLYVVDTCALISYFNTSFIGSQVSISQESLDIIDLAFHSNDVKLIFPATVFIEIFKKWFTTLEEIERIKAEVYNVIAEKENMEIQPFDLEILENFLDIIDIEKKHKFDNHDKQILASAMTMQCPLITSDQRIDRYNKRKKVIPNVFM